MNRCKSCRHWLNTPAEWRLPLKPRFRRCGLASDTNSTQFVELGVLFGLTVAGQGTFLQTHEEFGCVHWKAKPEAGGV